MSELRRLLVRVVDGTAKLSGCLAVLRDRCRAGITILMYHRTLEEQAGTQHPLRNLVVDARSFRAQMRWLAANFEVRTVRNAVHELEDLSTDSRPNRPLACVTFDDGYLDNFALAAPILEAEGIRATFFVTTGFVEGSPLWFDRAALAWQQNSAKAIDRLCDMFPQRAAAIRHAPTAGTWFGVLKALPVRSRDALVDAVGFPKETLAAGYSAMTPKQVAELATRGHEIGSHSVTHPTFSMLEDHEVSAEVHQSQLAIGKWIGELPVGFCYPNGDSDERVIASLRAAGFDYACGTGRGLATTTDDRMALPRRAILSPAKGYTDLLQFEGEVVGWHDLLRRHWRRTSVRAGS